MFTGLVEDQAQILELAAIGTGVRVSLSRPSKFTDVVIGDSIAVNGCCLTVVELDPRKLVFEAGPETLAKTSLGSRKVGERVNLERSLTLGSRLGGHLVTGHVDGQGKLVQRNDSEQWSTMHFSAATGLMRQMANKGSITVDGVSLTLVDVTDQEFSVALIPHTLQHTTLGELRVGDSVNLETDLLAKYVQRQLETQSATMSNAPADSRPSLEA